MQGQGSSHETSMHRCGSVVSIRELNTEVVGTEKDFEFDCAKTSQKESFVDTQNYTQFLTQPRSRIESSIPPTRCHGPRYR